MEQRMWRLSFSRAETVLLNSWTPTQQVAYHLLRFVIKAAGLLEPDEKHMKEHYEQSGVGIFHNYHLKSVVLWACERRSCDWWSSPVVSIVERLLHTLSECASSAVCTSYFVEDCNLFESLTTAHSQQINGVVVRLESIINEPLYVWLLKTYVSQCAEQCPSDIVRQFKSAHTDGQLREALSAITWRRHFTGKFDSICVLHNLMSFGQQVVRNNQIESCEELYEEITKIDERMRDWLKALLLARVAQLLDGNRQPEVAARIVSKALIYLNNTGESDRLNLIEQSCLKSTKELFQRSLALAKDELMNSKTSQASQVTSSLQTKEMKTRLMKVQVYSRCQASRESSRKSISVSCTRARLKRLLTELVIEHLTAFREAMSRDYSPNIPILITDYEALFLYKCGEYKRCFELCRQGVDFMLKSGEILSIEVFSLPSSDLLLLLDKEFLCVIGVAFLLGCLADNHAYRQNYWRSTQLAVSHYLILQCKLQLKHTVTSVFEDMHEVGCLHRNNSEHYAIDHMLLIFVFRKVIRAFIRRLETNGCSVRCVTRFDTRTPKPFCM
jgi:hypothetical protein